MQDVLRHGNGDLDVNADDALVATGVSDLLARYAHACDGRQSEAFGSLFLPDADFVVTGQSYAGPDGARRWLASVSGDPPGTHVTVNVVVEPDPPDQATSESAFVFLRRRDGVGPWEIVNVGRYHDRLSRAGGAWRFASREIVLH